MKKRLIIVIGSLIVLLMILSYSIYSVSIQNGQDTTLKIYQNDANGTPITTSSPIVLVSKSGHHNPFSANVAGYILASDNPLGDKIPRKNKTVHLKYTSALDKSEIQTTLANAKYVNIASEQVSTPVLNNQQYEGQKNRQTFMRLNTSTDGITWSKLSLNYPNVNMRHPSAIVLKKSIIVFNEKAAYQTKNYSTWKRASLNLQSQIFKTAKINSVFSTKNNKNIIVVRAKSRITNKYSYYYGQLNSQNLKVGTWRQVTSKADKNTKINTIQYIAGNFYQTIVSDKSIKIYKGSTLSGQFKLQGKIKNHLKNISSVGLVKYSEDKYRLLYSQLNNEKFQKGTYYRNLSTKFDSLGKQKSLTTDFFWYDFQTIRNED